MSESTADRLINELRTEFGYPTPHQIHQGRTIWSGRNSTILPSRTCSAFWGTTPVSSPEIRQIVHEVYSRYQHPTPGPREAFLDMEADRLSRQVAELAAELGERSISDWESRTGAHPDFTTKTGLLNTARSSALEIVLAQELYEKLPPDPEELAEQEPTTASADRAQVPWDQRWTRTEYRTEPDETLEDLAETLWPDPDFSVVFRIKAGYLLAARAEDGQPLPSQPGEDLAAELAKLVYADLKSDGLPER